MDEPVEQVEVEFASPILGYERGARDLLVRTPDLENMIREGHVRVVDQQTVTDVHLPETSQPSAKPTRVRGGGKTDGDG